MKCTECGYLQKVADVVDGGRRGPRGAWVTVIVEYYCDVKATNDFRINLENTFDGSDCKCNGRD